MNRKLKGVYLVTDTEKQQRFSHTELAEMGVRAGVRLIQYRDKNATPRHALEEIRKISQITSGTESLFIVNDRPDLAMAGDADGVHLGQDDLPIPAARDIMGTTMMIGGSSSTVEEAMQVERDGVDYVAFGHVFETGTKQKDYPPRGLEVLEEVANEVTIPLVAIGGITIGNALRVLEAGADIIAVSSAVCGSRDPEKAARELVDLFR